MPAIRGLQTPDDWDGVRAGLLRAAIAAERRADELIVLDIEWRAAINGALECCLENSKNLPPSWTARGFATAVCEWRDISP
ncbi:MAG: hypothetical protein KGH75_04995 [Rhodospirillales bacterium]|nr:hypothetical protein [Rhodospirillales bacterium]